MNATSIEFRNEVFEYRGYGKESEKNQSPYSRADVIDRLSKILGKT